MIKLVGDNSMIKSVQLIDIDNLIMEINSAAEDDEFIDFPEFVTLLTGEVFYADTEVALAYTVGEYIDETYSQDDFDSVESYEKWLHNQKIFKLIDTVLINLGARLKEKIYINILF